MARTKHTAGNTDARRRSAHPGVSSLRAELPSSSSRSARKQTTSALASRAQDSSSDDDGPSASNPAKRKRASSPQAGQRHSTRSQDNNNQDNEDDDSDDESNAPQVQRRSGKSLPNLPLASASTRRTSGKIVSASSRGRNTLKAVSATAARQRKPKGFTVSHKTGVTSEEDQDDDLFDLAPVGDDDDDDSDNGEREGDPPRTRSVSIAGYQWKAQDIRIRPNLVVKSLGYHRERRFEIRVNKSQNQRSGYISSEDSENHTDPDDPNCIYEYQKYKRGQLVYFLPDPEYLKHPSEEVDPVTVDDLNTDDWWLGLILDCAELKYKDGTTACVLRVAWCYSPDQAKHLFEENSSSRWAKQLEEHAFWDNEMIASDHVDFVGADSTGGPYKGGIDQNAKESALEEEYEERCEKALARHRKKYPRFDKDKKPEFLPPRRKTLPKSEKICIRLFIRGLEQSDVQRCTPSTKKKGPKPQRWIEEVHEPFLDRFAEKWAVLLSHQARRKRLGIPTQDVRRTSASQDEKTVKKLQLKELQMPTSGYGGGKGKGRGKTILPPKPQTSSTVSKRKGASVGDHHAAVEKTRKH